MTRRTLEHRIRRLEILSAPRKTVEPLLMLVQSPEPEPQPPAIARVVLDRFRDAGTIVWARRRIPSDPADSGLRCEPGSYLVDILTQFHQDCPWRKITGACRMCQGTPVAGSHSECSKPVQEVQK